MTPMRKILASISLCLPLAACSVAHAPPQTTFDLGAMTPALQPAALPPMVVASPGVPSWLDGSEMLYRLGYADSHELRSYANSRWSAPPLQLFEERLKMRLAEAGGRVLSPAESAQNVTLTLSVDALDFTQQFDRADHGSGHVALRVSLFDARKLVAQTTIAEQEDARSSDAAGGAQALSRASDLAIADIIRWIAGLNLPAPPQSTLPH
jgi:cholesterol transport system auxiliary component